VGFDERELHDTARRARRRGRDCGVESDAQQIKGHHAVSRSRQTSTKNQAGEGSDGSDETHVGRPFPVSANRSPVDMLNARRRRFRPPSVARRCGAIGIAAKCRSEHEGASLRAHE
jgi:hypothetical protein